MDPSRLLKPWIVSTTLQAFESHAKNRTVTEDGELAISCSSKKYVQLLEIVEAQEKQASAISGAVSDTDIRVEAQFTETCHRNFLKKHKKLLKTLQGAVFELLRFRFVINGCDGKLYENGITFAEQTRSSNSTKSVSGNGKSIPVTSLPSPSLRLIIEDCNFRPSPAGKPSKPVSNTKKHPELEKLLRSLPRKPQPGTTASKSKQAEVGVKDDDEEEEEDEEGWGSQVEDLPPLKSRPGANKSNTKKSTTTTKPDIYDFSDDEETQGFATQAFGTQLPSWKPVKKSPVRTYSKKGQPQPRRKEAGTKKTDDTTRTKNDDDSEDWDSDIDRIITPRDQQALLDREEESLYPPIGIYKPHRGRELKPAFRQHVPRIKTIPAPIEPDFPGSSPVEFKKSQPTGEPPSSAPSAASQKGVSTATMVPNSASQKASSKASQASLPHSKPATKATPSTPPRISQRFSQDRSSDSESDDEAVPWPPSPEHHALPPVAVKTNPNKSPSLSSLPSPPLPSHLQSQSIRQDFASASASIQPGQRNTLLSSRELDEGRWSETSFISPQASKTALVEGIEGNEDSEDGWSEDEMMDPVRLSQASQSQAHNFREPSPDPEDGWVGDREEDRDKDKDKNDGEDDEDAEEAMEFQSQLPPQAASHNRYLHSVPRPESRVCNGSDDIDLEATPPGASQFRFNPVATPKIVLSSETDMDDDEDTQKPIMHTPGSVLEKAAKEWASTPVPVTTGVSEAEPGKTQDHQVTPEQIGEVSLDYDPGSETEIGEIEEAEGEAEGNEDDEDTQRPFPSTISNSDKPITINANNPSIPPVLSSPTTPKPLRSRHSLPITLPSSSRPERPDIDASFTSHDSFSNELEPHFLPTPRKAAGGTISASAPAYLPSSDSDSEPPSSSPPVPSSSAKPANVDNLAKLRNTILGKRSKWNAKDKWKSKKTKGAEGPPITYKPAVKRAHPGPMGRQEDEGMESDDDENGQESQYAEEMGTQVVYKLKAAYKRAPSGPLSASSVAVTDDDEEVEDEEELPTRGQRMQGVVIEKMGASQMLQYARKEPLETLETQQMNMKRKAEMEKTKEIRNKRMKDRDGQVQKRKTEESPESLGNGERCSGVEVEMPAKRAGKAEGEEAEKEDTRSAIQLDNSPSEAQSFKKSDDIQPEEVFEDSYKSTIGETQFETLGQQAHLPDSGVGSQSMTRSQRPGFSTDDDDEDIPCAPAMPLFGSSMGSLFGSTPGKASAQPASSALPMTAKQSQPEIQVTATPPKAAQHHPRSSRPSSQLSQPSQHLPIVVPSTQSQPPQSPSATRKRSPSSSALTTPPALKKTKTLPKKTPPSATSLRMAKILDGIPLPGSSPARSRASSGTFGAPAELLLPKRNVMGEVDKVVEDTTTGETSQSGLDIEMKSPEKIVEMPILDASPQKKWAQSQQNLQTQHQSQKIVPPPSPSSSSSAPLPIKRAKQAGRGKSESQIQAQLDAQLASDIFAGSQQSPKSQEQEQEQHEPDSQYYSIPRSYDVSASDEDDDDDDGDGNHADGDMSWRSHKVDIGETTGEITEGVTEDFTKVLQEDVTAVTEYTQNPLGSPGSAQQASQMEKYMEVATEVEVSKEVASSAKTDAVMEEEEEAVDKEPMEEDPSVTQSTATTNAPTTTPVLTADLATELDFAMLQTPPRSPLESASQSQADTLTLLAAISDSQIPSSIPRSSGVSAVPDSSGSKPVEPQPSPRPHPRRIRVPGYSTFTAEQQAELESRRAQWFGIQRGERPRIRGIGEQIAVNQKFWAEVAERKEARNMQNNTQRREELEWYKDENTPFKKFVRNWERLKAVRMEREKAMEAIRKEEEARKTA